MDLEFEMFEGAKGSYEPKISVRSNGSIGLSQGALNRFKLRDGEWVVNLFYDKNSQVIGIKPSQEFNAKGAIKLIKRVINSPDGRESINCFISSKSFLDYYAIPYRQTKTFIGEWYEKGEMIIIHLNRPDKRGAERAPATEGGT